MFKDPFRPGPNKIVLCETLNKNYEPTGKKTKIFLETKKL